MGEQALKSGMDELNNNYFKGLSAKTDAKHDMEVTPLGVIATHKARAACKERKAAKEKADAEKAKAVAAGTAQPEEIDPYADPVEEEVCTEPEEWECTPNNLKVCDEKKTEIEALLADSAGLAEKLKDFDARMAELDATFDKNIDALMKKVELGSQDLRKARHDVWLE